MTETKTKLKAPAPRSARTHAIITHERYKALLAKHRLRQIDVAWLAGVGWRQARRWSDGDQAPPASWVILLLAIDEGLVDADWLARHATRGRSLEDIRY